MGDTLWVRRGEGITTLGEVHAPLSPTIPPSDRRRNLTTLPPLLGHILAFDRDLVPGVTSHGWITKETEPSGARCPCRYEKPEPHRLRWNVDCSRQPTLAQFASMSGTGVNTKVGKFIVGSTVGWGDAFKRARVVSNWAPITLFVWPRQHC